MDLKQIKTDLAPYQIGPYSQGIVSNNMVFISGQIPVDSVTGELKTDIESATHQIIKNISAILGANNMTLANVVKTTVFMTDLRDFEKMNEVYGLYFKSPCPARSTVAVAALPKNACLEIECIAVEL